MNLEEIQPGLFFGKLQEGDDVSDFDCEHEDTNDFLKDDALEYQKLNLVQTYVLKNESKKVIGFISLSMGAIKTDVSSKIVLPGVNFRQYPCLRITQLGVTKERKKQRLGILLVLIAIKMADVLKNVIGCTYVLVDSYSERITFYEGLRFKKLFSKIRDSNTMPMYYIFL